MNDLRRFIDIDSLFWGLALAGIGLLSLLDRFEVANLGVALRDIWLLFVIFLGRRAE